MITLQIQGTSNTTGTIYFYAGSGCSIPLQNYLEITGLNPPSYDPIHAGEFNYEFQFPPEALLYSTLELQEYLDANSYSTRVVSYTGGESACVSGFGFTVVEIP